MEFDSEGYIQMAGVSRIPAVAVIRFVGCRRPLPRENRPFYESQAAMTECDKTTTSLLHIHFFLSVQAAYLLQLWKK
jgi:hypothetical protein